MKWILTPLLVVTTIACANDTFEDDFVVPQQQPNLDWKEPKIQDPSDFNYVGFQFVGLTLGHRHRGNEFGWDGNLSLTSVILSTTVKGNISGLAYFGKENPFYVGLGPSAGVFHAIYLDGLGTFFGPELRIGKQFQAASGGNIYLQGELGAFVSFGKDMFSIWNLLFLPNISIGTSF